MTYLQSESREIQHLNIFVRFKDMKHGYIRIRMISKDEHHNIIFLGIFKIKI